MALTIYGQIFSDMTIGSQARYFSSIYKY